MMAHPMQRDIFGTCLFDTSVAPNVLMLQVFLFHKQTPASSETGVCTQDTLYYFFLEIVKKPLRGFSLTTRSAGRSVGSPFAFFSTFAKK